MVGDSVCAEVGDHDSDGAAVCDSVDAEVGAAVATVVEILPALTWATLSANLTALKLAELSAPELALLTPLKLATLSALKWPFGNSGGAEVGRSVSWRCCRR